MINCKDEIIEIFNQQAIEIQEPGMSHFNQPESGWINRVWANNNIRRAHIDVVDTRERKGLWMMHVCVFPVLNNGGPIYGFDVIAGRNKMTGAFHDFSPSSGGSDHPMILTYKNSVAEFVPKRQRELPEWAKNIFTDKMLAASNVNTEEETIAIIDIALSNLKLFFNQIGDYANTSDESATAKAHDWYCDNQRLNPHTPAVMKSLGLNAEDVDLFCTDMLFPKISR